MSPLKRLRLFIADLLHEAAPAWGLARMRDCERSGGHRWGTVAYDQICAGPAHECERCGCSESVSLPHLYWNGGATATATATHYTVTIS